MEDLADHLSLVIPLFFDRLFSPHTVAVVTIASHVVLTVIKTAAGVLSGSAGMIADAIDNGIDNLSAVLVWLEIRFQRELLKKWEEPVEIRHFMGRAQERMRGRIVFRWLADQLSQWELSRKELVERFERAYCTD